MQFTIQTLKKYDRLSHPTFKRVYDWDYVSLTSANLIACYRDKEIIRHFTLEEFAYLVVMTGCETGWNHKADGIKEKEFTAEDIVDILDTLHMSLSTTKEKEDIIFNINRIKQMFKDHGFEYYWPDNSTKFDADMYEAVGVWPVDTSDYKGPGYIAKCMNGGIKDVNTGKIYKFPKVFVSA